MGSPQAKRATPEEVSPCLNHLTAYSTYPQCRWHTMKKKLTMTYSRGVYSKDISLVISTNNWPERLSQHCANELDNSKCKCVYKFQENRDFITYKTIIISISMTKLQMHICIVVWGGRSVVQLFCSTVYRNLNKKYYICNFQVYFSFRVFYHTTAPCALPCALSMLNYTLLCFYDAVNIC